MYQLVSFFGQDDTDILPFFIEHYRSIGVARFHIFVHGDWTQAELALLRADDTIIAGVVQSSFDVGMKSAALEAYAKRFEGEWLVLVDADEFLELPYVSLQRTTTALACLGMNELPAVLLQRAAADGSLLPLSDRVLPGELFPCYDYRLADRMGVSHPVWKNKYPLVRVGPQFHVSRGCHLPLTGRPSAHIPVRGVLHHFKWRDRLLRSVARIRGQGSNQREQDAYRLWLQEHDFRLPTTGLKRYSRAALFEDGYLVRPTRLEVLRLAALRKGAKVPFTAERDRSGALRTLAAIPPVAKQADTLASPYLDRRGAIALPGRIALVTSDILGLRRSGGIGTAMAALAERLSAAGHEVHVFLSPYADFPTPLPVWIEYWERRGVRVHYFPRQTPEGRSLTAQEMSLVLCEALAATDWDAIHFPDAGGLGTATLLHRAAGLGFQSTRIAVTVHGPSRWHRDGNFLPWSRSEAEISELEAISINLADVLVFPSAYMMEWCRRHFPSPAPGVVIPNALTGESRRFGRASSERRPVEKIVFFGRIEVRKGIDRFIAAIETVLASGLTDFEAIFLGSLGQKFSEAELWRRIEHWPCRKRLLVNYTTHDAVDLLRTDNCLAVIPSRVDNSPYTVYECLENGVPLIASDVGGVAELVRAEDRGRVLVSGDADEYAAKILDALQNGASPAFLSFDPAHAELDLLSLHGHLVAAARSSRGRRDGRRATAPDATVIVYGSHEPDRSLMQVLQRWAEDRIEILWDRDPSAGEGAGAYGAEARAARLNRLVRSAAGDHLLFCHASIAPNVETLAAMLAALAASRADAIVCGYQTIGENGEAEIVPVFGGPPELSAVRNVYGARLFLVGKARFLMDGGFATESEIAEILEWEFLNRLKGLGGRVHAIPASMAKVASRPTSPVLSEYQAGRLAAPWTTSLPEPLQGFVRMALRPERKAGPAVGTGQAAKSGERAAADDMVAVPDVRGLELASLLARRAELRGDTEPPAVQGSLERPARGQVEPPPAAPKNETAPLVFANGSAVYWRAASPLNLIEAGWSEENEIGRQGIGSDGRLLRTSQTYVVEAACDAVGCDFLVADGMADAYQCRSAVDGFRAVEQRILGSTAAPGTDSFLRFEEVLATCPDAVAPILAAARRATNLTARFYELTTPIYPTSLRIAQVGAGTFSLPRRPIAVPRAVGNEAPPPDFAGLLCLSDEVEGGESYFTSLDIAVKPERGRYIGCTAGPHHERAVLRVASGTLLMLSLVMRFSRSDMSPDLRRVY